MLIPTIILFLITIVTGLILLRLITFTVTKFRVIPVVIAITLYVTLFSVYLQSGESILLITSLVIVTFLTGGGIFYVEAKEKNKVQDS